MCFLFKNNNKLLDEYFNYNGFSNKNLSKLKKIFDKKYLNFFYG